MILNVLKKGVSIRFLDITILFNVFLYGLHWGLSSSPILQSYSYKGKSSYFPLSSYIFVLNNLAVELSNLQYLIIKVIKHALAVP